MKLPLPFAIMRGAASLVGGITGGVTLAVMSLYAGWEWPGDIWLFGLSLAGVSNFIFDVAEFATQVWADDRAIVRARKGFGG